MSNEPTATPPFRFSLRNGTLTRSFATREVGGCPALAGTVRPATPREVEEYREKMRATRSAAEQVRVQSEFFATCVKTWNWQDESGQPVPIAADRFQYDLPYPVWVQLEDICVGYGADLPNG